MLHYKDLFVDNDFDSCDLVDICVKCSKVETEYTLDLRYSIKGNRFVKDKEKTIEELEKNTITNFDKIPF